MTNLLIQVIAALIVIESGGDKDAIGARGEVGILQIKEITVDEVNRLDSREWTYDDRWCPTKSILMARIILTHHYNRGYQDFQSLGERWQMPYGDATECYKRKLSCLKP